MIGNPTETGFWYGEQLRPDRGYAGDFTVRVLGEDLVYDADGVPISGIVTSISYVYEFDLSLPPTGSPGLGAPPPPERNERRIDNINLTVEELTAQNPDWYIHSSPMIMEGGDGMILTGSLIVEEGVQDALQGGSRDDIIRANGAFAELNGGAGNDTVISTGGNFTFAYGGSGDDVVRGSGNLYGNSGNDTLIAEGGFVLLSGGDGDDVLIGITGPNNEADYMFGDAGNDRLSGGNGADDMSGGTGNDTLSGGSGNDFMDGGDADDRISGDTGNDRISGGAGEDTIDGGADDDTIDGGAGRDTVRGGDGADRLTGGADADTVMGGAGDDTLFASDGADLLTGNEGADTFVFTGTFGATRVTDFDVTEDQIALDIGALTPGEMLDLFIASATQVGNAVIYDDGAGRVIALSNVDLDTLTAANFSTDMLSA